MYVYVCMLWYKMWLHDVWILLAGWWFEFHQRDQQPSGFPWLRKWRPQSAWQAKKCLAMKCSMFSISVCKNIYIVVHTNIWSLSNSPTWSRRGRYNIRYGAGNMPGYAAASWLKCQPLGWEKRKENVFSGYGPIFSEELGFHFWWELAMAWKSWDAVHIFPSILAILAIMMFFSGFKCIFVEPQAFHSCSSHSDLVLNIGKFPELDAQANLGWHDLASQTEGSSLWSFCTTEI